MPNALRRCLSLALALALGVGLSAASFAQAYTAQVSFLEEYASRLYDRGDYAGARKEFERIARLDPNNAPAAKYLKLLGEKPAADTRTPLNRIDTAITDITALKADINRYETGSRDLEYLIRNLITENDSLYSMLYLRSRELGELRAKFSGTPYEGPFDSLMKSLPPDRVPQHLHQSDDLLKLTAEAGEQSRISVNTAGKDAEEVQTLIQSVIAQKKTLASSPKTQELADAMDAKRGVMVDKTLAVMSRQESLSGLKESLARMNATLKDIDTYYRSIKTELSAKNFTDQKQFSDLMIDYAAKLKEVDALKTKVETADTRLAQPSSALAAQNASLAELNAALIAKDKQLAEFKSLLAEKTAIIARQNADLAFTDSSLDKAGAKLTVIEGLLKQNDNDLAELQAGIAAMRALVRGNKTAPQPAVLPAESTVALKELLDQKDAQLADLKAADTSLSAQLAEAQVKISDSTAILNTLKDENSALRTANGERTAFCNTLNARLAELAGKTADKNASLAAQKETAASLSARLEKVENQLMESRAGLSDKDQELLKIKSQARSLETELTKNETALQRAQSDLLAQKEKTIDKTDAIARLKDQIAALSAETEKLRGKSIVLASASPMKLGTAGIAAPANTEEARLLHETLARKDSEVAQLKKQLFELMESARKSSAAKPADIKAAVQNYSLDLQEKTAQLSALQQELDKKNAIIDEADKQGQQLQEKLMVMEAKQDAIKGVIQKREMEYLRLQAERDALAAQLKALKK